MERDEALVQHWLSGSAGSPEYPKIKALAQREKAGIYFGAAAHIRSDHRAGVTEPALLAALGVLNLGAAFYVWKSAAHGAA